MLMAGAPAEAAPISVDTTGSRVTGFLQKVQQAYKNASYLSVNLLYRYANKNQPDKNVETMSGELAMDRNRVRLVMDEVESITTEKYTIQVIKADKLIYLSTPKPAQSTDPISMVDTILSHMEGVRTELVRNNGLARLNIYFPSGMQYRSIAMTINESTGYFEKVRYELNTEGLLTEDQIARTGKPGDYQPEGIIEVLFSNYRQGQFTDSIFDEGIYFTRRGKGDYQPTEQYKDYQVYLASSNL
ncbi:hypothetical protein A4H97_30680 [Niastella yeongjuensis]|uniref:Uncharacterized protein n=2 Tax=Niastella yeongjuensis TaxID=354355 RepID=A0A1V9EP05_9BACT|nr:hypothetical protein A4H97_30680 [Niastella yeongjuensis]